MINLSDIYQPSWFGCVFYHSLNNKKWIFLEVKEIDPFSVLIKIRDKGNELKYLFYYNIDFGNNIESMEFEINKNGFGVGEVKFSERLNIDIKADYVFEVFFGNTMIYKGFAANDIDLYSKSVTLLPFSKRLQEWTFNGEFTNKTLKEILRTIINNTSSQTNVYWNDKYIDLSNIEPFSFNFKNEKVWDILEKLVKLDNDRYWYVDSNNFLRIRQIKKSKIDKHFMLNTYLKSYGSIKITFDYSTIEATEYKVFKNNADGKSVYIGKVGNPGNTTYPPLPITQKIRRIEGVYNASEVVNNTTALNLAYAELKNKAKIRQNISIENVNLNLYIPNIDDYLYIEYIRDYNENTPIIDVVVDNVVQIKYRLESKGLNCSIQCGDLIVEEGDELFNLKRKVRILETINNI